MTHGMAPATTPEQRQAAQRAGRLAAINGDPLTACPYTVDGDTRNRSLALSWLRGHTSHTPFPVSEE